MKRNHTSAHRARPGYLLPVLSFFLLFLLPLAGYAQWSALAKYEIDSGFIHGPWNYAVVGYRDIDSTIQPIFDDGYLPPVSNDYKWNCGRTFLFNTYMNDSFAVELIPYALPDSHDIRIYVNGALYDSVMSHPDTTPVRFAFPQKGYVNFLFYQQGTGNLVMDAYVLNIPKIRNFRIEAEEICASSYPASQDYHFKIKTFPSLDSILLQAGMHERLQNNVPGTCTFVEDLSVDIRGTGVDFYNTDNPSLVKGFELKGSLWTSQQNGNWEDHYVLYNDLAPFLTGSSGIPYLILTFRDGIVSQTILAPVIINGPGYPTAYHLPEWTVGTGIPGTPVVSTADVETWTPEDNPLLDLLGYEGDTIRIAGKLRIPAGKRLGIAGMTVSFGPEGSIEVESDGCVHNGGILLLDSATLTAFHHCEGGDAQWQGVHVWGDNSHAQDASSYPPIRCQGTLLMHHSTLSLAVTGVTNRQLTDHINAGGVIQAYNSRFRNNSNSVNLCCYKWGTAPEQSKFLNCDFVTDRSLPTAFTTHIHAAFENGFPVLGCRFTHEASMTAQCRGIMAVDCGLSVGRLPNGGSPINSRFSGFREGIYSAYIGSPHALTVKNTEFYNNITGVQSQAGLVPSLQYNYFELPLATQSVPKAGVVTEGATGFTIKDNVFEGTNRDYSAGVLVWNAGSSYNEVIRNSYQDLGTGNLSNFINRTPLGASFPDGLQFLCNSYTSTKFDQAARGSNSSLHGMAPSQGSAAAPAGNRFYQGNGHLFEIYNPAAEVGGITYHYYNGDPIQQPNNTLGGVIPQATGISNPCVDTPYNNGRLPRLALGRLLSYEDDAVISVDSLYYWIAQWDAPEALLLQTDLLIGEGRYADANTVYNGIAAASGLTGIMEEEYDKWGRMLLNVYIALKQHGDPLTDITSYQLDTLLRVADSARLWAKVRAQNWITYLDNGTTFVNEHLFPEYEEGEGDQGRRHRGGEATEAAKTAELFPNPVRDQLQVGWRDGKEDGVMILELCDLTGRVLLHRELKGSYGLESMDVRRLSGGMYLYRLREGSAVVRQGKLVKE